MGSLILCHTEAVPEPYEIRHIHRKISTMEELSFYVRANLCLVDETLFDEGLFVFLSDLGLKKLSEDLKYHTEKKGSLSARTAMLLKGGRLFSHPEIMRAENEMEKLKTLPGPERKLLMAKSVLSFGEAREAVLIGKAIESDPGFAKESDAFKGQVAEVLGRAYGLLFYYEEAVRMLERAYDYTGEKRLLVPYLYAARRHFDATAYQALLSSNDDYADADKKRRAEEADVLLHVPVSKEDLSVTDIVEGFRRH